MRGLLPDRQNRRGPHRRFFGIAALHTVQTEGRLKVLVLLPRSRGSGSGEPRGSQPPGGALPQPGWHGKGETRACCPATTSPRTGLPVAHPVLHRTVRPCGAVPLQIKPQSATPRPGRAPRAPGQGSHPPFRSHARSPPPCGPATPDDSARSRRPGASRYQGCQTPRR